MRLIITRFTLLLLAVLTFSLTASAQRTCGTMDVLEQQIQADPARAHKLQALERFTENFRPTGGQKSLITIPVVVHVVYRTGTENISLSQINSQIDVLNRDFRRLNNDRDNTWPQAADTEIEFCLASVDPNGNSTDGIIRRSTTVNGFGTNDAVKRSSSGGSNAWPAGDYMNMWVCNVGGSILGYAQFPGGPAATDGVVMDYRYFGTNGTATAPYNLGRTATHEVGHYLNLRHIWGDGGCSASDYVSDTPSSDAANYGCETGTSSCGSVDMVQNYMDYSNDGCMNLFTQGQKTRMQAALQGSRASLLRSNGCGNPGDGPGDGCDDTEITLTLTTDNYGSETSWSLAGPGGTVASGNNYGNNQTITETFCLPDGCYDFTINDSYGDGICCSYGNGSFSLSGGGVSESGGNFSNSDSREFCVGNSNPPNPTCNDGVQNGNETGVDCGGSCAPCNNACQDVSIIADNFEYNYGNWNDGGADCVRSSTRPIQGNISVYLRNGSSSSILTSDVLNLAGFEELTVGFSYLPYSMEYGEAFSLQVNNGDGYQTVGTWSSGTDFSNGSVYNESVTLTGNFSSSVRVRFRCNASSSYDYVHLDNIILDGCSNGNAREFSAREINTSFVDVEADELDQAITYEVFPNPATDVINVSIDEPGFSARLIDVTGRQVLAAALNPGSTQLQASKLAPGLYLLIVESEEGDRQTTKVVVR